MLKELLKELKNNNEIDYLQAYWDNKYYTITEGEEKQFKLYIQKSQMPPHFVEEFDNIKDLNCSLPENFIAFNEDDEEVEILTEENILNISNNILSHIQNLENEEDAKEFVRLYLLSLENITDKQKEDIIKEIAIVDIRFKNFEL